ncbi:coiled-coil domain-containing protein 115 [Poecile atricapillus]|uniref:coiled-coil domain-containing protein 115 n=1 Tax=Poecile atricapillus TaxID=48891 RepID=UPI002738B848|nr:coiled-coil domain-containing protein 115 [Poecile atricapillus]
MSPQGWLSLAQARYSLGCHRVSSLQYGATMVPRVRVCHRQDPEGRPRFEEGCGSAGGPRKKGGVPTRPPQDPLGWFGVLVPPSLRQAQGSFQRGVTLAVEVAELQAGLEAAAARYRRLLRHKRHRAGDSGDSGDTTGDTGDTGDSQTPTDTPGDTDGDTVTSVSA